VAVDIDTFTRELKAFDARRTVVQAMRRRLRAGLKPQAEATRAAYRAELPRRGGLNEWAARASITPKISYTGRAAGIRVRGSRRSTKSKADLRALDAGRVRHPSWGRRAAGQWHLQSVPAQVFTRSVDVDAWLPLLDDVLDDALEVIRRG